MKSKDELLQQQHQPNQSKPKCTVNAVCAPKHWNPFTNWHEQKSKTKWFRFANHKTDVLNSTRKPWNWFVCKHNTQVTYWMNESRASNKTGIASFLCVNVDFGRFFLAIVIFFAVYFYVSKFCVSWTLNFTQFVCDSWHGAFHACSVYVTTSTKTRYVWKCRFLSN